MFVGARLGPFPMGYFVCAILLCCAVLGYRMEVTVDGFVLRIAVGPGIPLKRIPLREIASCRPVRNRWWYGWGIHRVRNGWLYNVSGLDAVELVLRNGNVVRVGTDEPEVLHDAVISRIGRKLSPAERG